MPIEKIIVFSLAALTFLFLVLALTYFPSYAIFLAVCLSTFITAGILLPGEPKKAEKKRDRIISNLIIGLLILGTLALSAVFLFLWKLGPFGRLASS